MANADGSVPRDAVINTLLSVNVEGLSIGADGDAVRFIVKGVPEVVVLPDQVPRRMLQRFDKKFGVKIEYFYHPELISLKQH